MNLRNKLHITKIPWVWAILIFVSVFIVSAFEYLKEEPLFEVIKLGILSFILISFLIFYIITHKLNKKSIPHFELILSGAYLMALLFVMIFKGNVEFHLWMILSLLVTVLLDFNLGFMFTYHLIFCTSYMGDLRIDSVVYLLILGTIMCAMALFMIHIKTATYAMIIILSLQLILIFVRNNFILTKAPNINAFNSIISSLIVIVFVYAGYHYINVKFSLKKKEIYSNIGNHSLDEILDINFPLLQRMKEHSYQLFHKALKTSDIAGSAAITVGANKKLTRAAGLYYEVGRVYDNKRFLEDSMKLVTEYHLPIEVYDVIRQCNRKNANNSLEAAVVMITSSVITAVERLETSARDKWKNIDSNLFEKIVKDIFKMPIIKKCLDQNGLTLDQYNTLRDFFINLV